jgi:hypothetical protein
VAATGTLAPVSSNANPVPPRPVAPPVVVPAAPAAPIPVPPPPGSQPAADSAVPPQNLPQGFPPNAPQLPGMPPVPQRGTFTQ